MIVIQIRKLIKWMNNDQLMKLKSSAIKLLEQFDEFHKCVCKIGWIFNTEDTSCIECQLPCISCVDTINNCVTYKDQVHQQPESCECESGLIFDDNYFCILCLQPCKTCEIFTSKCLTCTDPHHALNNFSQCDCQSTYYSDTQTTCQRCEEPCFECDKNECINCIDINQILDSNKQCTCKPGYLQQNLLCLQYQNPCATCIYTFNECLTCVDQNQIVKDYKCQCKVVLYRRKIIVMIYFAQIAKEQIFVVIVQKRDFNFVQLKDVYNVQKIVIFATIKSIAKFVRMDTLSINQYTVKHQSISCDMCSLGYYLLDQKCQLCNENCLSCMELSEKYITCRSNYEINTNNQCICKVGYYEEQNQCYRCEYPCKICLNQTICQECVYNEQQMNYLLFFSILKFRNILIRQRIRKIKIIMSLDCIQFTLRFQFLMQLCPGYFWNQNNCSQCYQSCLTFVNEDQIFQLIINVCVLNIILKVTMEFVSHVRIYKVNLQKPVNILIVEIKFKHMEKNVTMGMMYNYQRTNFSAINRDGCSNCKIDHNYSCFNKILKQSVCFQFSTNCISCKLDTQKNKSQCIKCQVGFFLDKNDCVECSINCFECIDQAYNCISCRFSLQKNQKCQQCESGYYEDEINETCFYKCGDYIKIKEEECDDGNPVKGDGCDDQCKLEKNYIFLNGVSIRPNYPKQLLQTVDNSQIYSGIRLFKLSYTTHIIITDGFQIKDYLSLKIQKKHYVQQIDQSFELNQKISQINEFNQSELNLMINITFSRSSQDQSLLIKFYIPQSFIQIKDTPKLKQKLVQFQK